MIKHLTIIAVCCLLFVSCATEKRCLEKFGKADTIRITNIVYRDTLIQVTIEKLQPKLATGNINIPLIVRYGPTTVKTWVRDSLIYTYITSVDTTLKIKLDSAIKVIDSQNTIIKTYKEKYVPRYIRDLAILGGLVFGAFIFFIGFKFLKFFKVL